MHSQQNSKQVAQAYFEIWEIEENLLIFKHFSTKKFCIFCNLSNPKL